jgi:hypothetical protein
MKFVCAVSQGPGTAGSSTTLRSGDDNSIAEVKVDSFRSVVGMAVG